MHRTVSTRALSLGVVSLAWMALGAGPMEGQNNPGPLLGPQFGVGFVGNAPDAMVGGGGYVLLPELGPITGGIGLYVDFKWNLDDPASDREYVEGLTPAEFLNDPDRVSADFRRTEPSWWSINAAVVRPLTPFLLGYAGGGLARKTEYDLYNVSPNDPAGVGGLVLVKNPDGEETRLNLMAGIIMRLTASVSTHFGFETQPRGLTIGASLRLPRW